MLITRQMVQRLSPSIKEAQPQLTDSAVVVPSLFSFVGLPPEPFACVPAGPVAVQNSSFGFNNAFNQPASTGVTITDFCQIGNGYWRIQLRAAIQANFVGATLTPDVQIQFVDSVTGFILLSAYALNGSFTLNADHEFTVAFAQPQGNAGKFQVVFSATAVGQSQRIALSIIANRLL
jgi:hypothetical protein